MTKEEKKEIREIMKEVIDEKIKPICNQLNKMQEDIEELKEYAKVTREVTNELGKWVELNATPSNPYPTDKAII